MQPQADGHQGEPATAGSREAWGQIYLGGPPRFQTPELCEHKHLLPELPSLCRALQRPQETNTSPNGSPSAQQPGVPFTKSANTSLLCSRAHDSPILFQK